MIVRRKICGYCCSIFPLTSYWSTLLSIVVLLVVHIPNDVPFHSTDYAPFVGKVAAVSWNSHELHI